MITLPGGKCDVSDEKWSKWILIKKKVSAHDSAYITVSYYRSCNLLLDLERIKRLSEVDKRRCSPVLFACSACIPRCLYQRSYLLPYKASVVFEVVIRTSHGSVSPAYAVCAQCAAVKTLSALNIIHTSASDSAIDKLERCSESLHLQLQYLSVLQFVHHYCHQSAEFQET